MYVNKAKETYIGQKGSIKETYVCTSRCCRWQHNTQNCSKDIERPVYVDNIA